MQGILRARAHRAYGVVAGGSADPSVERGTRRDSTRPSPECPVTPDTNIRGESAAAEYSAPPSRESMLQQAITTTITGQPLPESVRPTARAVTPPPGFPWAGPPPTPAAPKSSPPMTTTQPVPAAAAAVPPTSQPAPRPAVSGEWLLEVLRGIPAR